MNFNHDYKIGNYIKKKGTGVDTDQNTYITKEVSEVDKEQKL